MFYVHYSTNHLKWKNGKKYRLKCHFIFPINVITSIKEYKNLKHRIYDFYPYFDSQALDGARMLFGTKDAIVDVVNGEIIYAKKI